MCISSWDLNLVMYKILLYVTGFGDMKLIGLKGSWRETEAWFREAASQSLKRDLRGHWWKGSLCSVGQHISYAGTGMAIKDIGRCGMKLD